MNLQIRRRLNSTIVPGALFEDRFDPRVALAMWLSGTTVTPVDLAWNPARYALVTDDYPNTNVIDDWAAATNPQPGIMLFKQGLPIPFTVSKASFVCTFKSTGATTQIDASSMIPISAICGSLGITTDLRGNTQPQAPITIASTGGPNNLTLSGSWSGRTAAVRVADFSFQFPQMQLKDLDYLLTTLSDSQSVEVSITSIFEISIDSLRWTDLTNVTNDVLVHVDIPKYTPTFTYIIAPDDKTTSFINQPVNTASLPIGSYRSAFIWLSRASIAPVTTALDLLEFTDIAVDATSQDSRTAGVIVGTGEVYGDVMISSFIPTNEQTTLLT